MGTQRRLKRERAIQRQADTERMLRTRIALLEQSAYGTFVASGAGHVRGSRPHGTGSTNNPRPLPASRNARETVPFIHAPDATSVLASAAIPDTASGALFASVFGNAVPD
jgi:hypothetical protein